MKHTDEKNGRIAQVTLLTVFGLMTIIGCCLMLMPFLASINPDNETHFELLPWFFGIVIGGGVSMGMVWLRSRWRVDWVPFAIAVTLWLVGATLFFFGGTAVFLYDEPAEFASNLGFSVGLCMAPGILFIVLSFLIYIYHARRNRSQDKSLSSLDPAAWIDHLKEDEHEQ